MFISVALIGGADLRHQRGVLGARRVAAHHGLECELVGALRGNHALGVEERPHRHRGQLQALQVETVEAALTALDRRRCGQPDQLLGAWAAAAHAAEHAGVEGEAVLADHEGGDQLHARLQLDALAEGLRPLDLQEVVTDLRELGAPDQVRLLLALRTHGTRDRQFESAALLHDLLETATPLGVPASTCGHGASVGPQARRSFSRPCAA